MSRDVRELDWQQFQNHRFLQPSPDLSPYVARYWDVTWDYTRPYWQLVVPYPNVHLSFGDGAAQLHGVSSRHVVRELVGAGRVFGVAFQPGCFRPFLGKPVQSLTDRAIPALEVFPKLPDHADVQTVEGLLRKNLPPPDPRAEQATAVVNRIITEPAIKRVDMFAEECNTSVRGLQRLFAEHVGVGPKWVIRRYRLHEVTQRMEAREPIEWAALAADLGYADQAHLVRDFSAMFGESPTQYAARY
ncbi:helix-turn-helix domain-containing protein [soil metagenome]